MRDHPGARRHLTALGLAFLALGASACAQRVERPAPLPPPQVAQPLPQPAPVPPPQVAPQAPAAPQLARRAPVPPPVAPVAPAAPVALAPQAAPKPLPKAPPPAPQLAAAPPPPPPPAPAPAAPKTPPPPETTFGATTSGKALPTGPRRRYSPTEFATEDYENTVRARGLAEARESAPEESENVQLALIGNTGVPEYYGQPTLPPAPEPVAPQTAPEAQAPEPPVAELPPAEVPVAAEEPPAPPLPEPVQVAEVASPVPPSYEPVGEYASDAPPAGYEAIIPSATYPTAPATPQVTAAQTLQPQGYSPQPAAPIGSGPVTIALLTPNSDPRPSVQALAKDLSTAAALAAKDIGDSQLVLRGYDTAGTPERAALAAEQAIADGAQLIIGPLFSGSASAAAQVAGSYGVNVIAFTTDRSVLRRGLYSLGYLPDTEIERIVSFAAKRGITSLAALAPDTPYGGLIYSGVNEAGARHGISVPRVQPFQPRFEAMDQTAQDFADFYKTNPDLGGLLMVASGKSLQALSAYLAFRDVLPSKVKFMGLGLWDDPETFREATLRGGWFPGVDPAKKAEFGSRFRAGGGGSPAPIASLGYDGVVVAAALLAEARQGNPAPFAASSLERPQGFDGMSGLFRLLPDGRNQRQLAILEVGRREFTVIDPAPASFDEQVTRLGGYGQ